MSVFECNEEKCAICITDITLTNKTILSCGHYFHYNCLRMWNKHHNTCPVCRNEEFESENTSIDIVENTLIDTSTLILPTLDNIDTTDAINHMVFMSIFNTIEGYRNNPFNVSLNCNECTTTITTCSTCRVIMCGCENNNEYMNGSNPFWKENCGIENTCKQCFDIREETLKGYIFSNTYDNIFENTFIINHYELFYKNYSDTDYEYLQHFDTYEEFKLYANITIINSMVSDLIGYNSTEEINNDVGQIRSLFNSMIG